MWNTPGNDFLLGFVCEGLLPILALALLPGNTGTLVVNSYLAWL